MATGALSAAEISAWLEHHPRWSLVNGRLHREYDFGNFQAAFGFMHAVAEIAEKRNHHPDWSNSYGRVVIDLMSHDVGALTKRDLDLAAEIDRATA